MPMRQDDLILYRERAPAQTAIDYAKSHGAMRVPEVEACIRETYRLCAQYRMDPCLCIARQCDETGGDGGDVYCSPIWTARLNVGGIGVTDGGDEMMSFADGEASARAFVAHMVTYSTAEFSAGELRPSDDPRYRATVAAGTNGSCIVLDDLEGKWYTNPMGTENTVARGNAVYPSLPSQGATPVADYETEVPGLPGGVLKTTYPIRINLIPAGNTHQRPGITARAPRRSVQHGTGNPNNPDAWAESMWFVNGAGGGQASIHYCVDDHQAVVVVPLDECTWQAADGAGPGNMNGFSCEQMEATVIWNDFGRRDALIRITADLMGRTAARLGVTTPERHWDFNQGSADRHHCPNQLMNTGLWESSYVPKWQAARADELKRMNEDEDGPGPPDLAYPPRRVAVPDRMEAQGHPLTFTKPSRFTCVQGGYFKTAPNREAPNGTPSPYKAGRTYTLQFATVLPDGERWLVSGAGSWAPSRNFEVVT